MTKFHWVLIAFAFLISTTSIPSYSKDYNSYSRFARIIDNAAYADEDEFRSPQKKISSDHDADNDADILLAGGDEEEALTGEEEDEYLDYLEEEEEISDPFESVNRVFFDFNDKLYFWVLKPVAKGYSTIVPEKVRISIKHFFNNISTPIRIVNNMLQMKFSPAGNELIRFGVNSTVGVLGLFDVAKSEMGLQMQDEDFGQTLGTWGLGAGFYINWPILGPSSLRDSVGSAGDYFLDPINYVTPLIDRYAIKIGDQVNRTSLSIGEYEEIKKEALDPYAAIRDIYFQYRESKVNR